MVKRMGGFRRKTRSKLRKPVKERGKLRIRDYMQSFQEGEKVSLKLNPSVHKGVFLPRFYGKIGTVLNKNGTCYNINIKDGKKQKTLIVHPVHLGKLQNAGNRSTQ